MFLFVSILPVTIFNTLIFLLLKVSKKLFLLMCKDISKKKTFCSYYCLDLYQVESFVEQEVFQKKAQIF